MWAMFKLWLKFTAIFAVIGIPYWVLSKSMKFEDFMLTFYFYPIGAYLLYKFVAYLIKSIKNTSELRKNMPIHRNEFAKRVNKELFYFDEYHALAFDNEKKRFEYLKVESPKEKDTFSMYDINGFARHWQKDFFKKNIFNFYPVQSVATNTQYITQTVSTDNINIISKQKNNNITTAIGKVVIALENGAQFEFSDNGCYDREFPNHPPNKSLRNQDTQGNIFPTFHSFYEKYALKLEK